MIIEMSSADGFEREPRTGHGNKYHRKFPEAIQALVTYSTRSLAAQALGVSTKTLQRWLRIRPFRDAYELARQERESRLLPQLLHACPEAVATLLRVAKDGKSPEAKIRAAEYLLRDSRLFRVLESAFLQLERSEQQREASTTIVQAPTANNGASPRGHGSKLDTKQEEAIAALLTERTVENAAKRIDVAPKTLQAWMRLPEFDRAYRRACLDRFAEITAQIETVRPFGVTILQEQMRDGNVRETTRVRAAHALLLLTATTLAQVDDLLLRVWEAKRHERQAQRRTEEPELLKAA